MTRNTNGKYRFPKTLSVCADRLYKLREERLSVQKLVEKLAAEEAALKEYIIESLPKQRASGISGKLCRVSIVEREVPVIQDITKVIKYAARYDAPDLIQKRLSAPAVRERWEAGKEIPGVGRITVSNLSIHKV